MLRWPEPLFRIEHEIIKASIEHAIVHIDMLRDAEEWEDPKELEDYPMYKTYKIIGKDRIIPLWKELTKKHEDKKNLYMIGDTIWLFLYECAENYVATYPDLVADKLQKPHIFMGKKVESIDFDWINNCFWDNDFLLEGEAMQNLPSKIKESMGFSEDTFSVCNDLLASKEDLEFELVTDEPDKLKILHNKTMLKEYLEDSEEFRESSEEEMSFFYENYMKLEATR